MDHLRRAEVPQSTEGTRRVTRHGWTRLHVTDWTTEYGSDLYPIATFHRAQLTDRDRCDCHTNLCTRPATQEDLLCDECRAHPDCRTGD